MKFDLENDSEAVQTFVLATIEEFQREHGRASVIRFDVQAFYGQIHAYPSTQHTPETIFEDVGKPVNFIFDCDSWFDHRRAGDTPEYKNLSFNPESGDGKFNDFVSVMVYDAVVSALKKLPPEQCPQAVLVESAPESGGVFRKLATPE